jgi:hypothetical protein
MKNIRHRIVAATPLISLLIFLAVGYYLNDFVETPNPWLLGSCAFLLIPLNSLIFAANWRKNLKAIILLSSLLIFLVLGIQFNLWNPGWVVLLSVFVYDIIAARKINLAMVSTITVLCAYLIISFITGQWDRTWIIIILIPIINILIGPHSILDFSVKETKQKFKDYIRKDFVDIDDDEK